MRVLTSSVLILEAIVVGLAIPVAMVVGAYPAMVGLALGALALACLLLPGLYGRPVFVPAGWLLQGLALASSALVPMMLPLAIIFMALWFAALHFGAKADATRAAA